MIKALRDRVLVKKEEQPDYSPGGILIPENCKEVPQMAEVLDVGPGTVSKAGVFIPTTLKVGDRVVFGKYTGVDVWYCGTKYALIREAEIFATVEKEV